MANKPTKLLYKENKLYRKLFNLMFNEFGWDATSIDEDCLTIYKLVVKYAREK